MSAPDWVPYASLAISIVSALVSVPVSIMSYQLARKSLAVTGADVLVVASFSNIDVNLLAGIPALNAHVTLFNRGRMAISVAEIALQRAEVNALQRAEVKSLPHQPDYNYKGPPFPHRLDGHGWAEWWLTVTIDVLYPSYGWDHNPNALGHFCSAYEGQQIQVEAVALLGNNSLASDSGVTQLVGM
jgi:hypothetical protein